MSILQRGRRKRSDPVPVAADILRLVSDAEHPLTGPAAVALAQQVQDAIGEASDATFRRWTLWALLIRAGQASETLIMGGWRDEDMQRDHPDECRAAVETWEAALAEVHAELLAIDPAIDDDPFPAVSRTHVDLVTLHRTLTDARNDPIAVVRGLLARYREIPVEAGPDGFADHVAPLISAGERLVSRWPAVPASPGLDTYLSFQDAMREFERAAAGVRRALVTLHPRLRSWPDQVDALR
jgi:hypothetical protein